MSLARHLTRHLAPHHLITVGVCLLSLGFATLDGDKSRWQSSPTFSISGELRGVNTESAYSAARSAVQAWQAVSGVSLSLREVSSSDQIPIEFLQAWPQEFGGNASGVTLTYRGGGRITRAEVYLNDDIFSWSTANTTPANLADVQGVLTHELGHALGLTHSFYRAATMYWSSSDEQMRALDEDDERGLRYLYGGVNAGRLCDTCQSNDECQSGTCINFDGVAFCGATCGPAPQYVCSDDPTNAACFELQNGGSTCAPLTLTCNDEAVGVAEQGDYCFGAQHCQGDLMCVVRDDDARCEALGQAGYGEACDFNAYCESELCLPLGQGQALCSLGCNPRAAEGSQGCPPNSTCLELDDPELEGVCLPPGDVPFGGACNGVTLRCEAGFECNAGRCSRFCEPYGECPSGLACTPVAGRWRCEPLEGPAEGEACQSNRCGGGLFCLQDRQLCVAPCDPSAPEQCGGHTCLALSALGVCSPGDAPALSACEEDFDCLDFSCVEAPTGLSVPRVCAPRCDEGCPEGWRCAGVDGGAGGELCEVAPPPEPPQAGSSSSEAGAEAPQAGASLMGGGSASGGSGEPVDPNVLPSPTQPGAGGASGGEASASAGASCAQSAPHSPPSTPLLPLLVLLSVRLYRLRRLKTLLSL